VHSTWARWLHSRSQRACFALTFSLGRKVEASRHLITHDNEQHRRRIEHLQHTSRLTAAMNTLPQTYYVRLLIHKIHLCQTLQHSGQHTEIRNTSSYIPQRATYLNFHSTSPPFPTLMKSNLNLIDRLQHNIRMQPRQYPTHPILHSLIPLKHPHQRILHLRQRKLLANANARTAIERDVRPALRVPVLPALGHKLVDGGEAAGFRRVQVCAALHD
jgi:hypothetical protein